jgi:3-oxoacyl-[acyl-carrier-protein] synthase III
MQSAIRAIEYHLPEARLTNDELARDFPEWDAAKILDKTGIRERRLAGPEECASDLAYAAARKLFAAGLGPAQVDYILLCTQAPDYFLPTTACLLQDRLGIPTTAGALDYNLGCSGFVYGLSLAKGLIETGQARNVLLLTAETYSKFIHPADKTVRTIFGDAGTATWVAGADLPAAEGPAIGPFVLGTDGSGAANLMVRSGGLRHPCGTGQADVEGGPGQPGDHLYMNGAEIFTFTLKAVPAAVSQLLARANLTAEQVDLFVFHQANLYMLEHLRKKLKIPEERFAVAIEQYGNTVSNTIPIALKDYHDTGRLAAGQRVMLVGFGVGYSWGAAMIRWGA